MNEYLTNLLPIDRQKKLRRSYYLRLFVAGALLLALLFSAAAILLFPTYLTLSSNEDAKRAELASAESRLSSADEKDLSTRLALLTGNAKVLETLATAPSPSHLIGSLLAVPRPGITVSGYAYTPVTTAKGSTKKLPASMNVTGMAATRDALRNYQLALQEVPFVSVAALPVSAYAQSTDIFFTITLTLTP